MKEVLSINLGQCGIQVASCFWEMLANAVRTCSDKPTLDVEQVSSYFSDTNDNLTSDKMSAANREDYMSTLKARCILVDTDLGTISEILQRQHLHHIDSGNIVCGTEATGNNWSTAYCNYGPQYHEAMEELLSTNLEICDESFQYFNLIFGLAGGTGAGLGSYVLDLLSDEYGKVPRVCNVITEGTMAAVSPYNTVFCLKHLNDLSSITNLFSNEALSQQKIESSEQELLNTLKSKPSKEIGFNHENGLISSHLKEFGLATVSKNYPGFNMRSILNTLIPLPGLNLTCPSMAPKNIINEGATTETLINELVRPSNRISPIPQKIKSAPIAMAIHGRFNNDSFKYIKRLKLKHNMVGWNRDAVKISLPGVNYTEDASTKYGGMYGITNDSSISPFLQTSLSNFDRLYSKRAFWHHYSDVFGEDDFSTAREHIERLRADYETTSNFMMPPPHLLNETSLASLGVKVNNLSDKACTDVWNETPGIIESNKQYWWSLNGSPLW
ncbi:tubulin, putative [Babesia bigemina]|uniref:Tubulin, putative n=1 Tax=Babesia bigemina TaxID=5866 RepID=A0A061D144_BABBI|nr:tubulin, putative [Babesia bigemina]CDR94348.1 tubulin, putative [Babesia bigemina]|eukprot:XP_012766534.1 tubulin, putative [Babesia bigemina]